MDRGAWWATVHGVRKNQTLSDFTLHQPPPTPLYWGPPWRHPLRQATQARQGVGLTHWVGPQKLGCPQERPSSQGPPPSRQATRITGRDMLGGPAMGPRKGDGRGGALLSACPSPLHGPCPHGPLCPQLYLCLLPRTRSWGLHSWHPSARTCPSPDMTWWVCWTSPPSAIRPGSPVTPRGPLKDQVSMVLQKDCAAKGVSVL